MDALDSIVDMLDKTILAKEDKSDTDEILVPRKCAFCKSNVICSVLPTFIGISRIGIVVGVEECQYYVPMPQTQKNQQAE
jgi:hypothetical protein